ncbi:MAG: steroid delta-isomerase protein [Devosia sp.]|uniref:nuclear transport factor 2 family protein n=1 Tax=Devosia sp. TaxID=1871048 RepID=UPI002606DE1C|nr:nuclear transport factor 2 family protein [Devosia sp.]MDB5586931.1 steroid delta-isomerase protein [Devosia sp.]
MTPLEIVEEQFAAYNARDLERFMACFADTVRAIRLPDMVTTLDGKAAYAAFYAKERFAHEGLRAELVNRIAYGNKVIDHELIHGLGPDPIETAIMFVIEDGLIATAFAIPGK